MAKLTHDHRESIILYDVESRWQHPDLDFEYIADVSEEAANVLAQARDPDERQGPAGVEVAYQPGDGTFYGVIIAELCLLGGTRGRVKNGVQWESNAVRGVAMAAARGPGLYLRGSFLISILEWGAYPLTLGDRDPVAGSYIEEHWGLSKTSALSVAILLRAISWHLD